MGSLDGFEYFVDWLISLGREPYEQVIECPDRLIELPQVLHVEQLEIWTEDEWPEFERLSYVAYHAYTTVTGLEVDGLHGAATARGVPQGFPLVPAIGADFHGEKWELDSEAELRSRMPRIARYKGLALG